MSADRPPRVVALVAARDEEAAIAGTVVSLLRLSTVAEVVVIDDGSTDRTAELAVAAGARVLVAPANLGKGDALEGALERILPADVYLLVDGDVGDTAEAAGALLEPVLSGELDLAVGRLPPQPGGGFGLIRRMASALVRSLGGVVTEAPLSGQRALTRRALEACRPLAPRFGVETAMTIDAARLGLRVGEVDVQMRHRPTGRSAGGFLHRARQGFDALSAAASRAARLR